MPYIIDGHNLIPNVEGLALQDINDEMQLVEMLQEYCRLSRKTVYVYFDNAPPGQLRAQRFGRVTAHFARAGTSADQAIRGKLARLGKEARNWSVVSSDLQVQSAARAAQAQVIPADVFAKQMHERLTKAEQGIDLPEKPLPSPDELDQWLRLFGVQEE